MASFISPIYDTPHKPHDILSTILDTQGHKIERLPGNRLIVSRIDGSTPTQAEATEVANWFWRKVGIPESAQSAEDARIIADASER